MQEVRVDKIKKPGCPRGESEFQARLIRRNLLILLKAKNARKHEFAQVRYTAGTRSRRYFLWTEAGDGEGFMSTKKVPSRLIHFARQRPAPTARLVGRASSLLRTRLSAAHQCTRPQ